MMKPIKHIIGCLALSCICFFNSNAQTSAAIQNSFNEYNQKVLQEKLFVHTDKSSYLTGEILWFKIYYVDALTNKPLDVSKVAYVDVLDNNQNPVMQAKIALKNGSGDGSLYIPVSVNNGNYTLRAYTNWMKNFSPDLYFEKKITIINPLKSPEARTKQTSDFDVQFFPEGGYLVKDIKSKVAFKAVGKDGKGLNVSGAIVNHSNDTVVRFKSLKFGIGSFAFTPASNETYKAVVWSQGNKPLSKELPAVKSQGYAMQLAEKGAGQLEVTVTANVNDENVFLFVHTKQTVAAAKTTSLNSGVAKFTIDKGSLGEGITHFTVFNAEKQPVCERLYFKRPKQNLLISAAADQQSYNSRHKINIDLLAKDAAGKPLNADLSMSVYRVDNFQPYENGEIMSYLWLSSELKGSIESPEYYFNTTTAEGDEALDNLMLSQGWRRFEWKNVLSNDRPAFTFLPEYNGHIVNGKLTDASSGNPAKDVIGYLGIPSKRVQLYVAKSDSSGRLLFNSKDFYGPGEIVVQTNSQKDSTYRIEILNPFSEKYSKNALPQFSLASDMQADLEAQSVGMQVQNIYSSTQTRQFYNAVSDSSAFYATPVKSYKLDDYTRFPTMEEVLREYVKDLNVVRRQGRFHIKMIDQTGFLENDPLVVLDGVPVFNIDKIFAIDPLKVRRLDVLNERYFLGPSVHEGVLSYTTYKGDLGGYDFDPHTVVLDYEGLQLQREFYSPVYDNETQQKSRTPDFRNVLYWSPSINMNAQGKSAVTFYSSDEKGKYVGVIQGMNSKGDAGSQTFSFEVK